MNALPITLLALLSAGDFEQAVQRSRGQGVLLQGNTAVLVALAGEDACAGADEIEDCEATRAEIDVEQPEVLLGDFEGLLLPPLGSAPPSLLLPTFPYGLEEWVIPSLDRTRGLGSGPSDRVRLLLPEDTTFVPGGVEVSLLAVPETTRVVREPTPTGPARGNTVEGPRPLVMLDLRPRAIRIQRGAPLAIDSSWAWDGSATATTSSLTLVEPARLEALRPRLTPAATMCARDGVSRVRGWYRRIRKPRPIVGDVLLALSITAEGRVADAAVLERPWDDADIDTCLVNNARLLSVVPPPSVETIGLMPLQVDTRSGTVTPPGRRSRH